MRFNLFKRRFRHGWRQRQRQVEGMAQHAEADLEKLFFRRLQNLGRVWRFITAWVLLLIVLIAGMVVQLEALGKHYQTLQPVAGGTFTEGILGNFTNANPLYATKPVDATVSRLIFAGLFTYNEHNQLVGDLAQSYSVDDKGTNYTVQLKPNLTWQDGKPLTADDVVFTYKTIQNPDAQSPLLSSWQGITVTKKNDSAIVFTLPNPLSSFPYSMTNGIVPQHLLGQVPPADLRSADFDTLHPVGAGPFMWRTLQVADPTPSTEKVLIALKPFTSYVGGQPKLDSFVVSSFVKQDDLLAAFQKGQVNSMAGLDAVPAALTKDTTVQQNNLLLTAANMAFFNTSTPILSDATVRKALVQATDTPAIRASLGYPTHAVTEPFLINQLAYDKTYQQAGYDPAAANAALDKAGWSKSASGIRQKDGKSLEVALLARDTPENQNVTHRLQHDWEAVGAKVDVQLLDDTDLQPTIDARNYDVLLYGISIGTDPDVFVYWHSSQTDPRSTRLNFSQYKSTAADASLEAGRTRLDPALRVVKYRPFLQAWQQDAPAVGLYQPRYLYLTSVPIHNLPQTTINTPTDRFDNVQNWMIRTARVTTD